MKRLLKIISNIKLKELDEADIKLDRCPLCKYEPLERSNGFKFCRSCGTAYKMFDGDAYIIEK